ncbi:MAG: nitrite reductase, copper-containing [Chloroflexi bacterium]|nr:MAG: nitrite reductase, copper-containing [Chloroflexota bacterium]MBL1195029.1 nitrite reductase, copper-containing [Chloroflexota bacterium]NOH12318.1 nitrite reductase, copper-containing [Chloroflexota bacterium]
MRRFALFFVIVSLLAACDTSPSVMNAITNLDERVRQLEQGETPDQNAIDGNVEVDLGPVDVSYTLLTGEADGRLVFYGVGGEIDGEVNPTLSADPGDVVEITLVNGHPVEHDLFIDKIGVATGSLTEQDEERTIVFQVEESGKYSYYCTIPGHRAAGMEGLLVVGDPVALEEQGVSVVKNPADLPPPIGSRGPELVKVELVGQEVVGQLADGTAMTYFTFNGTVPGPFIRARVGDTVEVSVTNATESTFVHSIDLHAVNGPGGGAVFTQTDPGETTVFNFKALAPGIYVYHCATPSVAHHIANGMYGLILIEPEGGLPIVDREFYVMQGEIYTVQPYGEKGFVEFSHEKMLNETPEYFMFNGAHSALTTEENALRANVGETVRIYMGVGGPNFTSSFHVIGEIFDRVYPFGSLTSEILTDVQTISVAPGGAWVVEFAVDVPGTYILVDHALSRVERGLVGYLIVEGEDNPEIFSEGPVAP